VSVILKHKCIPQSVILTLALLLVSTCPALGGPAQLGPVTVVQPDGTKLTVRMFGDERFLITETLGGYTIIRDGKTDEFRYAIKVSDGRLAPSDWVVGKHDPVKQGITKHIRPSKKIIAAQIAARRKRETKPIFRGGGKKSAANSTSSGPSSGPGGPSAGPAAAPPPASSLTQANILVILADFAGGPQFPHFANTSDFESRVFSVSSYPSGSVRDLYAEASYGQFNLNGSVIDWVTAPNPYAYYCCSTSGMLDSYPYNSQGLVVDLCQAIDATVDFSQYDADGDGYVDGVVIVFEGELGWGTRFWPHAWSLGSNAITLDGKIIDRYCLSNEQKTNGVIEAIGVFCHELGHVFGAPDLYDYTPNTASYENDGDDNDFPVAHWCLMARGAYNGPSGNPGAKPSHPCALVKEQFFGWITPQTIDQSGSYLISAFQTAPAGARAYKIPLVPDGDEYLLISNRGQNVSSFDYNSWDGNFRNSGILVTHVDWNSEGLDPNSFNDGPPAYTYYAIRVEDHAHPSPISQWPYELKLDAALSVEGGCTSLGPAGTQWATLASNYDGYSPARIYNVSARGAIMSFDLEYLKVDSTMPQGDVGYFYNYPAPVTGNASLANCSITSGSLPGGLVLDGISCMITGTPTGPTVSSTFTLRAQSGDLINYGNVTITIANPVQVTGFTMPANWPMGQPGFIGQIDTQYGAQPLFFDLVNAAELPPGLILDNATGTITGTPTTMGSYLPQFVVTDAAGVLDSGIYGITIDAPSIIAPPVTGLTWSRNGTTVTLDWDETSASVYSAYLVYREDFSFSDVGAQSPIASVTPKTTTTYDDVPPGDLDYYYAVAVLDNVGYINPVVIPAGPVDVYPPLEATGPGATPGNRSVTLIWTASASADVAGYKVAWDDGSGSGYGTPVDVGNTLGSTVNNLDEEASYTFKITAYDEVPNESPGVTVASTVLDNTPPADVPALTAIPGLTSVRLIWTPSTTRDVAGYRVAVDSGSGFSAPVDVGDVLEYKVTGLMWATRYTFRVTAYDEVPNVSPGRDAVEKTLYSELKKKKNHCSLGAIDDNTNSIIGALLPILLFLGALLFIRRRRFGEYV